MDLKDVSSSQQYNPNFGMALKINKGAEKFIEALPAEERQYLQTLGRKIKKSRHHITINENGNVGTVYEPKASEIRLVNESESETLHAADKAHRKAVKKEMTVGEKIDNVWNNIKSMAKILKLKMSLGKSKFMRNLQINEELQKTFEREDALQETIERRLEAKAKAVQNQTQDIMSEFGA